MENELPRLNSLIAEFPDRVCESCRPSIPAKRYLSISKAGHHFRAIWNWWHNLTKQELRSQDGSARW